MLVEVTRRQTSTQHQGSFVSRQKYPAMEKAAQDKMSSPALEVFKGSASNG